jgi:hypothetical protein
MTDRITFAGVEAAMLAGVAARRASWPEGRMIFLLVPIEGKHAYCVQTQDSGAIGSKDQTIKCFIPTTEDRVATDWELGALEQHMAS